jgi:hypothetical protein
MQEKGLLVPEDSLSDFFHLQKLRCRKCSVARAVVGIREIAGFVRFFTASTGVWKAPKKSLA